MMATATCPEVIAISFPASIDAQAEIFVVQRADGWLHSIAAELTGIGRTRTAGDQAADRPEAIDRGYRDTHAYFARLGEFWRNHKTILLRAQIAMVAVEGARLAHERTARMIASPAAAKARISCTDCYKQHEAEPDKPRRRNCQCGTPLQWPSTKRTSAAKLIKQAATANGKHPSLTGTTTPAGIAANDPDADPNWLRRQRAEQFADGVSPEAAERPPKARHGALPGELADELSPWQEQPEGQIVFMDVELFVRHPDNRRPTAEAVAEKADSMEVDGQLEPIEAWPAPGLTGGKLQILSGETRWLAARKLGWLTIQARIVTGIDASEALELIAKYNGLRRDLNPIEKARLIQRLCEPREKGGSGLTREAAAREVGGGGASWASQQVALLELPEIWQDRVASGELEWTWARELIRLAKIPRLLGRVDEAWRRREKTKDYHEKEAWKTRANFADWLTEQTDEFTRPIVAGDTFYYGYQFWKGDRDDHYALQKEWPLLFELTPELEAQLEIAEVEVADKNDKQHRLRRATNWQLYDQHQMRAIKLKVAQQSKSKAEKAGRDQPAGKALTPAQSKAKAKEQAEHLQRRVDAWRHDWLKVLVARELGELPALRERLLIAIALDEIDPWRGALADAVIDVAKRHHALIRNDAYAALIGLGDEERLWEAGTELVKAAITTPDKDPRMPLIQHKTLDEIATTAGIDLAIEWRVLQEAAKASRQADVSDFTRWESFFQLFQTSQLDALGGELGVHVGQAAGKAAKIKLLTTRDRSLPLPKCIAPLVERKRRPSKPKVAKKSKGGK